MNGGAQSTERAKKRHRQPQSKSAFPGLIVDREISTPSEDAFGHRDYAELLRALVESPSNTPPYSIGLLGRWGTGKSSVKALYLDNLRDDQTRTDGHLRRERVQTITFNAWRFGGENMKRALLRHVYISLGGEEATIKDALFHQLQSTELKPKPWIELRREMIERYVWMFAQVAGLAIFTVLLTGLLKRATGLSGNWATVATTALTAILALVALTTTNLSSLVISRYKEIFRVELPRSSAEEYEDLLIDQLQKFRSEKKDCRRLLVFVDDLDRLSAEEMVNGLDAVRTFMELPEKQMPANLGVVFVISCDEDRVAGALEARRRGSSEIPAVVLNRMDARRYLDRIFQFRVEVPPFPPQDLRSFAEQRLRQAMPEIAASLDPNGDSRVIRDVVDRMIHVDVQDPRNAIQLLNAFGQSWHIASLRERLGRGSNRTGALQKGVITSHPEVLAAFVALQVNFPDFYAELQAEPRLIEYFSTYYLRQSLNDIPDRAIATLQEYSTSSGRDADDQFALKPIHSALRRYITSLQGLRWPQSLQPFLLLSQDPISRKYGDRARTVLNALVSGDSRGVLIEFGRELDERKFGDDDVQLLRQLQLDTLSDTPVRRDNSIVALAELADRFPEADGRSLLSPVAMRLLESPEMRSRLGLESIERVYRQLANAEKLELAERLVWDLLPDEGEITFTTRTGEKLAPDEAVSAVQRVVPLVLSTWQLGDFNPTVRTRLIRWMKTRTVNPGQRPQVLPFVRLENWLEEWPDKLLDALGADYLEALASELQRSPKPTFPIMGALARSRRVVQALWAADRDSLWRMMTRFVSLQNSEMVELAASTMSERAADAPDTATNGFICAFAKRLVLEMTDGEWELQNVDILANSFLRVSELRAASYSPDSCEACVSLFGLWSSDSATAAYAIKLISLLNKHHAEYSSRAISELISGLPGEIDLTLVRWLGEHFATILTSSHREELREKLKSFVSKPAVVEEEIEVLGEFVRSIDSTVREIPEAQQIALAAVQGLDTWYDNSQDYVEDVLPRVARLFGMVPASSIGSQLQSFFGKVRNQGATELFGFIHQQLTGSWPVPETVDDFNAVQVFHEAAGTMASARSSEAGELLLASMADMVTRGVVPPTFHEQLTASAIILWPSRTAPAARVLASTSVAPSVEDIADLGDNISLTDSDQLELLSQVWTHLASLLSDDEIQSVAEIILEASPKESEMSLDTLLNLWINAQQTQGVQVILTLLGGPSYEEDQRRRIWLQFDQRIPNVSLQDALQSLAYTLTEDAGERILDAVVDSLDDFYERFPAFEQHYDLAKALLEGMARITSERTQDSLADWIERLNGEGVLSELHSVDAVSPKMLEVLKGRFPNSSYVREFETSFSQED